MDKIQICKHLVTHGYRDEWACRPKDVGHAGNWIFHVRPDYPDEAECLPRYRAGKRQWVISSEFWDGVPTSESPVGTKDQATIAATVARLDAGYRDYLIECENGEWIYFESDPKKRYTHQLMSDSGKTILPFTEDNLSIVKDFAEANANFRRTAAVEGLDSKKTQKFNMQLIDAAWELKQNEVFQQKLTSLTGWVVEYFDQWEMLK